MSKDPLKVENFDKLIPDDYKLKYKNRHWAAPQHPFYSIIAGPSGSGKSNILMHLIFHLLHFDKIYIYAKDPSEDKYRMLEDMFKIIDEKLAAKAEKKRIKKLVDSQKNPQAALTLAAENQAKKGKPATDSTSEIKTPEKTLTLSSSLEGINVDAFDPEKQHLIIFDDMINERDGNQKAIKDLFIRGRKKNASIVYLAQSYFKAPKIIRDNAQYIMLTGIDNGRELNQLQRDHASRVSKDLFLKAYNEVAQEKYNFLMIDKKTDELPMHIRKGFGGLFLP